jgi:hypothetical protein
MSKLIGATDTVLVPCKALLLVNGKKKTVGFNAVYTRLTRTANKELQEQINEALREVRGISLQIVLLDKNDVHLNEKGRVELVADSRLSVDEIS